MPMEEERGGDDRATAIMGIQKKNLHCILESLHCFGYKGSMNKTQ